MVTQEHVARVCRKTILMLLKNKIRFVTALNKCLTQIRNSRSFRMCAHISKLPSKISTKFTSGFSKMLYTLKHYCDG